MRHVLALFLLLAAIGQCQAPDVSRGPIAFSGVGNDSAIWVGTGQPNGAVAWRLTYFVDGTNITAAQVAIQGANAPNSAGCAAASFATIATANADIVESANPSVSGAQGNVAVKSYYPCIRTRVTAITGSGGTVSVTIAGWKGTFVFPTAVTVTPSGTQDVNLTKVAGMAVVTGGLAGTQGVGGGAAVGAVPTTNPLPPGLIDGSGNLITPDYCTKKATFGFTAATGNVQLVAVSGTTTVRICHVSFASDTVTNLQIVNGTGATCTSSAAESGVYQQVLGFAFDFASPLITTSTKTICLNSSATVTGGGTVIYSQR